MSEAGTRSRRAIDALLLAAWFAIVTGLLHVAIVSFRRFVLGQFTWTPRDVVWEAPLAYVAMFLPLGVLFALIAGLSARWPTSRFVAGAFALLSTFSILLLFPQLHHLAALALSLGAAVQVSRVIVVAPGRTRPAIVRSLPLLAGLVVLLGVGDRLWLGWRERQAVAALPAAREGAPNVLLLILDTVRSKSLSLYGYPRETTPNLARWGAKGAVFERAIAPSPWTLPSHASMFTGRYSHELDIGWLAPFGKGAPTLAEQLRAEGYATAGFAANQFYASDESGLDRGFDRYRSFNVSPKQILLSTSISQTEIFRDVYEAIVRTRSVSDLAAAIGRFQWYSNSRYPGTDRRWAPHINREFLAWQKDEVRGRPFFAFLNYFDAHAPYKPPSPWGTRYSSTPTALDRYDGSIAYLDAEIGALLDELQQRGVLDNTLLVIASDHGEQFGERGLWEHGNSVYLPAVHVPLILHFPGRVPAGIRVAGSVTLRDLPTTILDLVGSGREHSLGGRSLAEHWTAAGGLEQIETGSLVLSELSGGQAIDERGERIGSMRSITDDSMHYVRHANGREELFRHTPDSLEAVDLARTAAGRRLLGGYRAALTRALRRDD